MIVLPYQPQHCEAAARLWLESWLSAGVPTTVEVTVPELVDRLPEEIAAGWSVHLGWKDGVLVGFLAFAPATSCLEQIFVLPAAQGRGFGTQLLYFARVHMPEGIWLTTPTENARARRFYEKHGFRAGETGVSPRMGHPTIAYHWP